MAVTVVLDHSRQHLFRRAWRQLGAFWGGALLVVGLAASLVAVPTTLAVASFVFGWLDEPEAGEEPWPAEDVPVGEIFLAWGISTPIAIVGLKIGIRLLRGDRELVLFLRRFGYDDATKAVTFAAAKTVGGTWRLVTLDDKEIAPLGVPAGTRRLYGIGSGAFSVGAKLGEPLFRVYALAVGAMCAIVGLELLRAPDWRTTLDDGTFDPYFDTFGQLVELHPPFDAMGWSLPGVFAVLATLTAVAAAAAVVYLGLMMLMFPLAPVLVFLSSSADAMKAADEAKTLEITSATSIPFVASSVAESSRKVFAPRLVVLRVATPVWQETVKGFAAVSSVPLIDLSDVSENVLWEIEELTRMFGERCLLVGRHDRVARLAAPETPAPGSLDERLLRLLDGHEVLAYTTDRRGIRRFARSLRARLLTVTG
jgi:hypothetical protein